MILYGGIGGIGSVAIKKITVTNNPTTMEYKEGKPFDPTGMEVTATYTSGNTRVLNPNEYRITPTNVDATGIITISYTENRKTVTTTLQLTVDVITGITTSYDNSEKKYYYNDVFDRNGLTVKIKYNSGDTEDVSDYTVDSKVTLPYVTVRYSTYESQVPVVLYVLSSIEVTNPPTKTRYKPDEYFSPVGMVVTARYTDSSGDRAVVTYDYVPKRSLTLDDTEITITYTEDKTVQTTQAIKVATYTAPDVDKPKDEWTVEDLVGALNEPDRYEEYFHKGDVITLPSKEMSVTLAPDNFNYDGVWYGRQPNTFYFVKYNPNEYVTTTLNIAAYMLPLKVKNGEPVEFCILLFLTEPATNTNRLNFIYPPSMFGTTNLYSDIYDISTTWEAPTELNYLNYTWSSNDNNIVIKTMGAFLDELLPPELVDLAVDIEKEYAPQIRISGVQHYNCFKASYKYFPVLGTEFSSESNIYNYSKYVTLPDFNSKEGDYYKYDKNDFVQLVTNEYNKLRAVGGKHGTIEIHGSTRYGLIPPDSDLSGFDAQRRLLDGALIIYYDSPMPQNIAINWSRGNVGRHAYPHQCDPNAEDYNNDWRGISSLGFNTRLHTYNRDNVNTNSRYENHMICYGVALGLRGD